MLDLNVEVLNESWAEQKRILRDALLQGDVWDASTGLSLSSVESNPEMVALFTRILAEIDDTLSGSGFPKLNRYFLMNLETNITLVINHGDNIYQGLTLNPKRVNLGLLFNVAVPKALAKVKEARI